MIIQAVIQSSIYPKAMIIGMPVKFFLHGRNKNKNINKQHMLHSDSLKYINTNSYKKRVNFCWVLLDNGYFYRHRFCVHNFNNRAVCMLCFQAKDLFRIKVLQKEQQQTTKTRNSWNWDLHSSPLLSTIPIRHT